MPSINILVVNRLGDKELASIQDSAPNVTVTLCKSDEVTHHIEHTDILVTWGHLDISEFLPKAHRLKWVHALSAGVERLLPPEMIDNDIIVTNSRGIHGIPMAEHVLSLILAFSRGLPQALSNQKKKLWKRMRTDEIYETTIGIVGLGSIGREIAKRAKALGMKVLASKRTPTTELFVNKLYTPDQLDQLLAASDYVVATLPLTEKTAGMFCLDKFKTMKRSAYFINVARGGIVNEKDLITALENGTIKGAGLDVFETEPLPETSPLWDMDNVILTPHVAAMSPYYLERAIKLFLENFSKYLHNADMLNVIDKEKGY